jgi:hypothetical protein
MGADEVSELPKCKYVNIIANQIESFITSYNIFQN